MEDEEDEEDDNDCKAFFSGLCGGGMAVDVDQGGEAAGEETGSFGSRLVA